MTDKMQPDEPFPWDMAEGPQLNELLLRADALDPGASRTRSYSIRGQKWAALALVALGNIASPDADRDAWKYYSTREAMTDLLTSLMFLADDVGMDFDAMVAHSRSIYDEMGADPSHGDGR